LEYYTYEDYKKWEGDWELIKGFPLAMTPSPVISHQYLTAMFIVELNKIYQNCEECMVLAEEDWIVEEDTVLRPDVSVVCNEQNEYITKAPEIIVEVVSKSTAKRDEKIKFDIYEKEMVKHYILAYPEFLKAKVFKNIDGKFKKVGDFTTENLKITDTKCEGEVNFDTIFKKLRRKK